MFKKKREKKVKNIKVEPVVEKVVEPVVEEKKVEPTKLSFM